MGKARFTVLISQKKEDDCRSNQSLFLGRTYPSTLTFSFLFPAGNQL